MKRVNFRSQVDYRVFAANDAPIKLDRNSIIHPMMSVVSVTSGERRTSGRTFRRQRLTGPKKGKRPVGIKLKTSNASKKTIQGKPPGQMQSPGQVKRSPAQAKRRTSAPKKTQTINASPSGIKRRRSSTSMPARPVTSGSHSGEKVKVNKTEMK